jgi:hypothetical protein
VKQAPNWDIGFIVGVPAWIQMCMERIIERYQLKNIHEIWPNLGFFVHGGVSKCNDACPASQNQF